MKTITMKNLVLKFAVVSVFLSSVSFAGNLPVVSSVSEDSEMLEAYLPYLQFVMEVGREVDANNANKLARIYGNLKKRSPGGAALFLKGLRFEMIQKADLMVQGQSHISSRTPEYRRFVAKYLHEWVREADEHLFRSYASQIAKRE